jgi:hypothetical protein
VVNPERTVEDYKKVGIRCIKDYYARFHPFNQHKVIGIEQYITIDLGDNRVLRGYIDRLDYEGDGVYAIHDYKTQKNMKTQEQADEDWQLAIYAIGVKKLYPDCKRVKLIWHILAHDKDAQAEKKDEELDELLQTVKDLIKEIEATQVFPANEGILCGWCNFRPVCPKFAHLHKIEKLLENEYMQEDGVQLVNKYLELTEQRKKLNDEIDKISEAIYEYGEKEHLDVIYGDNGKLRIWKKECIKMPGKNDPLILEVAKILQSVNKYDDVCVLDTWKLEKIMGDGEWPPEIVEMLKGFGRKETIKRIYVSKK